MNLAVLALALAQQPPASRAQPIPEASRDEGVLAEARVKPATGTTRNAGVYHATTGTWTRKAQAAGIGADVVYDNTCTWAFPGAYSPLSGDRYIDEGRIPSTSSPTNLSSRPGCADAYVIDGFQIAYCTDQAAFSASTTTIAFFEQYAPCTTVVGLTPTASFAIVGLPGAAGTLACWQVTVDLDSPPQSASLAFTMAADGDGSYAAPQNSNLFGWSIENSLPDAAQTSTGPMYAGDDACGRFDGTRWDSPVNYAEDGTGMGTLDEFRIEDGPTTPGCYFFSCCLASFHLELYADACPTVPPSGVFCLGDGTPVACPCGNHSPPGQYDGCLNSLGVGGRLRKTGSSSLASDTLMLLGSQMPDTSSCLYFQGTIQQAGGAGAAFGDGKRCAGGTVVRLGTKTNASGASRYPAAGDPSISVRGMITAPGTRTYQAWYRNAASFCTSATFNLSNGVEVTWAP